MCVQVCVSMLTREKESTHAYLGVNSLPALHNQGPLAHDESHQAHGAREAEWMCTACVRLVCEG